MHRNCNIITNYHPVILLSSIMKSSTAYQASVAVLRYCPPILLVFGTFGNVMIVVILRRMKMQRSAMFVYLTTLAVSDTCLLYTGLLRYWMVNVFDVDIRTLHTALCKLHTWFVYSLIIVSAWILTFMTVERTLSVWQPHRVSLLCTRSKAIIIVVSIVAISMLVNSHLLYSLDLVASDNGTYVCSAPSLDYLNFFDTVWAWVDLTLSSLIPFTVLLIGNCLILCKVYSSVRSARYLGSVGPGGANRRKKKISSMTVTLVGLSVIFFLTTAPICVYNIIEHYVEEGSEGALYGPGVMRLAWAIVNILMYINNSVNFYLYCLSGTNFRKELRKCLCCYQKLPRSSTKNVDLHDLNNHYRHSPGVNEDGHHPSQSHREAHYPGGVHEGDANCHTRPPAKDSDTPDSSSRRTHSRAVHPEFSHVNDSSVDF